MVSVKCPTCDKSFDPALSRAMPFCSERCRRIDLRRWLSEEISIPYHEDDHPERAELPDGDDE